MKCLFHTSFYVVWFFKHVTLSDLARLVLYQLPFFVVVCLSQEKLILSQRAKVDAFLNKLNLYPYEYGSYTSDSLQYC